MQFSSECSTEFKGKKVLPYCDPTDDEDKNNKTKPCENYIEYQVKFMKTTSTLQAVLSIHKARYPAVPPKWKIICPSETHPNDVKTKADTGIPLYNPTFAEIEKRVNVDLLRTKNHPNEKSSSPTALNDDYCEWIVIHQIIELIKLWDGHLSNTKKNDTILRTERGRDHMQL